MIIDRKKLSLEKHLMIKCMQEHPPEGKLLKEALESEMLNKDRLYDTAYEHEVVPILYAVFSKARIPVSPKWKDMYQSERKRIEGYFTEIHKIGIEASKSDIEFILLKNGAIAEYFMDDYGKCPMGDIDVLCRQEDLLELHRIILSSGFELNFRNPNEAETQEYILTAGTAEYFKKLQSGDMWLEISSRSVSGRWIRPDQEPDSEYLFRRSKRIHEGIRVLNDTDNLLQVSLHTAKHSYVRAPGLRLHLDVERIVTHGDIDWEYFTDKCIALNVKTPVYFSLIIPRILFDTPVPDDVLAKLKPSPVHHRYIGSTLRRISLFSPHEKKFSKLSFALFQIMLYDSIQGILKLIFPERSYMKERYNADSPISLLRAYINRIADILLRKLMI